MPLRRGASGRGGLRGRDIKRVRRMAEHDQLFKRAFHVFQKPVLPERVAEMLDRDSLELVQGDFRKPAVERAVYRRAVHGQVPWSARIRLKRLQDLVTGMTQLPELSRLVPEFEIVVDDPERAARRRASEAPASSVPQGCPLGSAGCPHNSASLRALGGVGRRVGPSRSGSARGRDDRDALHSDRRRTRVARKFPTKRNQVSPVDGETHGHSSGFSDSTRFGAGPD